MKTKILILFVLLFQMSCNKDSDNIKPDPVFQLPPETQTGANTFGVTINGKVYIPRDPTGGTFGPSGHGMTFWGTSDSSWNELEVKDGASKVGFKIYIHLQQLQATGVSKYKLKTSNFQNGIDSIPFNNIFFKIWDFNISNYAYYGSVEDQGEVNITRYDLPNRIVSANFSGKFVRNDNPNDFIKITDGRFDIKWSTLDDTLFP